MASSSVPFEYKARKFAGAHARGICVGWDKLGQRIATGGADSVACVWKVGAGGEAKQETKLKGHKAGGIHGCCWDPNNANLLATASSDRSVRLWDVRSGTSVGKVSTSGKALRAAWRPRGDAIAIGDDKGQVSFVDVKTFQVSSELTRGAGAAGFCWDAAGDALLVANGTGHIEVFDYPALGEPINEVKSHMGEAVCVAADPTGQQFATGGSDAIVSLWDAEAMCCERSFAKFDSTVTSLAFDSSGDCLAYASEDGCIAIVNVGTGGLVHEEVARQPARGLAWSPRGRWLACVGLVGDARDGREVLTIGHLSS